MLNFDESKQDGLDQDSELPDVMVQLPERPDWDVYPEEQRWLWVEGRWGWIW